MQKLGEYKPKDTKPPHTCNYPLSKKEKTIWSLLFFPPHEGFNNFSARVLRCFGERRETPKCQLFLLSSRSEGMLLSKQAEHHQHEESDEKPKFGCYQFPQQLTRIGCYPFPQQLTRSSQLPVWKPEQIANRCQHVYETSLAICLFFLASQTVLPLDLLQSHPPLQRCCSTLPRAGSSQKKDFSALQSTATHGSRRDRGYASRSAHNWLRPIRAVTAPFLLGSPTYL